MVSVGNGVVARGARRALSSRGEGGRGDPGVDGLFSIIQSAKMYVRHMRFKVYK